MWARRSSKSSAPSDTFADVATLRPALKTLLLLSIAVLAALAAGWLSSTDRLADRDCTDCNLLIISIDTLRADRLSVYGYPRPTSPALEALAREGVLFEDFHYSGGGTLPSHMSMMTSLHPATHGIHPGTDKSLEPERVTLAEQMQAAHFATAAFVDGGWLNGRYGFAQGFDTYDDFGGRFEAILPKALAWLELPRHQRFFLFVHTYDVHSEWTRLPYDCPGDTELRFVQRASAFDGCVDGRCASELLATINAEIRSGEITGSGPLGSDDIRMISDLYDGCIRYVDDRLAELFARLKRLGLWDKTIVVVTSDHGEEFFEHGLFLHDQGGYEELSHIPLIIKLPHSGLAGRRVPGLAAMVDLAPTLLELSGAPTIADAQGQSLRAAIESGRTTRRALHMYSVLRTENWKYFSDEHRLFDLASDPRESSNLYAREPESVQRLERAVRGLIAIDERAAQSFARRAEAGEPVRLAPEEVEKLRALGYLR